MEVIEKRFEKFQLLSMGVALFGLIVGIVLIGLAEYVNPQVTNKVLAGIIVIGGLTSLVKYFYDGFANSVYKFEIVSGIAMLITGIFMVFASEESYYETLGIYFGIYCLLSGLMKGFYSYKFLKENESIFALMLMLTVLFVVMGILLIFNPFKFMEITSMTSIFLAVCSVFDLMAASLFKKRAKHILKIFE